VKKEYEKFGDFKIVVATNEDGKIVTDRDAFLVVDRNDEIAIRNSFRTASEAIEAGYEKYKVLTDE